MDAKKVSKILSKLQQSAKDLDGVAEAASVVRKPRVVPVHPETTMLPPDYLQSPPSRLPVAPDDIGFEAALRTKQDFPPRAQLPAGGDRGSEYLANKAEADALKESVVDLEKTDPGVGSKLAEKPGLVSRTLNAIGKPQRVLMQKLVEAQGGKGDSEDSERSAQELVERAAESFGIPEDSTVGNAAKALGVAGLEVFADPTNLIPGGAIAKRIVKATDADKLAKVLKAAMRDRQAAALAQKVTPVNVDELAKLGHKVISVPKSKIIKSRP